LSKNKLSNFASIATILSFLLAVYIFWTNSCKNDEPKIVKEQTTLKQEKPKDRMLEREKLKETITEPEKPRDTTPEPERPKKEKTQEQEKPRDITFKSEKSEPTPSEPKNPKPITLSYLSNKQAHDIAILYKKGKSKLDSDLKSYFKNNGFKSSSSVFNSSFKNSSYYRNLEDDASGLKAIGLDKTINCICLVDENISFDSKAREGVSYLKATGSYDISIINVENGEIDYYNIETFGAGTSENLATKSVHEHLLENKDFKNINIDLCKN